jgi:hypothetical protein
VADGQTDPEPVSVRTRFERFPATVKGAFVIRGEGRDPHQVRVREARAARVHGSGGREVPVEHVTADVPPHQDLFVPFELAVADMDAGWYGLELDLDIDGSPRTFPGDRRFVVAWPRGSVRSGPVPVDRTLQLGDIGVHVERIQCSLDSATVRFVVRPPGPVSLRLEADGQRLPELAEELDEVSGRGLLSTYPVFRSQRKIRIVAVPPRSRSQAELTIDLD